MVKFIQKIYDNIKEDTKKIKELSDWGMKEFEDFYKTFIPKQYEEDLKNKSKTQEEVNAIVAEQIANNLSTPIASQRIDVKMTLLEEIEEWEKFLHHYELCCQEYKAEIEVTSLDDIIVRHENRRYYKIYVSKVKLSLLCDLKDRVVKKNSDGHKYYAISCSDLRKKSSHSFYEVTEDMVYFYTSPKAEKLLVGPYDKNAWDPIGFLGDKIIRIRRADGSLYCFNQERAEIMIANYDEIRFKGPIVEFFGEMPSRSWIVYKTIKYADKEAQLIFSTNHEGIIQTDIVDRLTGTRYGIDKSKANKDAIAEIYEHVLNDLEQEHNSVYKHSFIPNANTTKE